MSTIIVDDTNTNIQYAGPWFTAQNSQLNIGSNGPPFQNTLHGVNANASFSYSFSGSEVIVLGASITKNTSGIQDPTWECFIDNISIGWNISAGSGTENSWVFCQSNLQDGPHILTTKVTVLHQQTFWFDQIQYISSSNVSLDNLTVRVDSSDPAVQYSSGWTELDKIVNLTQNAGSTVTYEFFGVSLSWLGFIPSNFSLTPSSGIYSIDGQNPILFFVPALGAANALPLYNQVLFKTETLSPGQHKLVVTYQGNSETAPLALDAFIVQNATSPSTSSSSVPSSSSSISTSNLDSNKSPPSRVAIIVGVVGGAIVLVLVLLLLYIRRRNNWRAQRLNEDSNPEPFPLLPNSNSPPNYTLEAPSLTPQPFSSKFRVSRRREIFNAPVTGSGSGSSRPTPPPVIEARINTTTINSAIRNTETIPVLQPSTSPQGGDLEFLQHADSVFRMPHAEGNLDELPPGYASAVDLTLSFNRTYL